MKRAILGSTVWASGLLGVLLAAGGCGSDGDPRDSDGASGAGSGGTSGGAPSDPAPSTPGSAVELEVAASALEPLLAQLDTAREETAETLLAARAVAFDG